MKYYSESESNACQTYNLKIVIRLKVFLTIFSPLPPPKQVNEQTALPQIVHVTMATL